MTKAFITIALIFFIGGISLAAFPMQKEPYTEENTLNKWDDIGPATIDPNNPGLSWTLEMQEGSFFELNVSASDIVRVRIGASIHSNATGKEVLINLIFDQTGTRFSQKVAVGGTDTYQVEIKNEGTTPVNIWGMSSQKSS